MVQIIKFLLVTFFLASSVANAIEESISLDMQVMVKTAPNNISKWKTKGLVTFGKLTRFDLQDNTNGNQKATLEVTTARGQNGAIHLDIVISSTNEQPYRNKIITELNNPVTVRSISDDKKHEVSVTVIASKTVDKTDMPKRVIPLGP